MLPRRRAPSPDAGLLRNLTHRGLFGGLARLDVALRQRPQQPTAAVDPADQGGAQLGAWAVETPDDQPACGRLAHGTQPRPLWWLSLLWFVLAAAGSSGLPVARLLPAVAGVGLRRARLLVVRGLMSTAEPATTPRPAASAVRTVGWRHPINRSRRDTPSEASTPSRPANGSHQ